MKILISGANGNLGHLIIRHLLENGTPASDIVAGVRNLAKGRDLEAEGIQLVRFDYDDYNSMVEGLKGIDRFLMMSVTQMETPLEQFDLAVKALKTSDVKLVAFVSLYRGEKSRLLPAAICARAEKGIRESGIPYVFLRDNAYLEVYLSYIMQGIQSGVIQSPAGDAKISGVCRDDLAQAAAIVIKSDEYTNRALELAGDTAFTFPDLARIASEISGRPVTYRKISLEENMRMMKMSGYPKRAQDIMGRVEEVTAAGELESDDHTLSQIIGHKTVTMEEFAKSAFRR